MITKRERKLTEDWRRKVLGWEIAPPEPGYGRGKFRREEFYRLLRKEPPRTYPEPK